MHDVAFADCVCFFALQGVPLNHNKRIAATYEAALRLARANIGVHKGMTLAVADMPSTQSEIEIIDTAGFRVEARYVRPCCALLFIAALIVAVLDCVVVRCLCIRACAGLRLRCVFVRR